MVHKNAALMMSNNHNGETDDNIDSDNWDNCGTDDDDVDGGDNDDAVLLNIPMLPLDHRLLKLQDDSTNKRKINTSGNKIKIHRAGVNQD
jgi:hypothetical protein